MEDRPLYLQIVAEIRQEILEGALKPGERLPALRRLTGRWNCTPATIQRAYHELARQGLVSSRAGQGTRVAAGPPAGKDGMLAHAALVNRAESFLLEALTGGSTLDEVEACFRQALDRWRAFKTETATPPPGLLRFCGSHDPAVALLASRMPSLVPGLSLQTRFAGSLGGLMALAEGQADLAGCHLWDAASDTYNTQFVLRLLPGRPAALVTLAHRRLGLAVRAGNPDGLTGLDDLTRPGLRFVNRQSGSGTRVWLDAALKSAGVDGERIQGYEREELTHTAVARAIAEGRASAGLVLETSALAFGLDFIFLTNERYDLVMLCAALETAPMRAMLAWLDSPVTRQEIQALGGYDTAETGRIQRVE